MGPAASLLARIKKALRRADDDDETSSLFEASRDHAVESSSWTAASRRAGASACRACFRRVDGPGERIWGCPGRFGVKNDALLRIRVSTGGSSVRRSNPWTRRCAGPRGGSFKPDAGAPGRRFPVVTTTTATALFCLSAASYQEGVGVPRGALVRRSESPRGLSTGLPCLEQQHYLARVVHRKVLIWRRGGILRGGVRKSD